MNNNDDDDEVTTVQIRPQDVESWILDPDASDPASDESEMSAVAWEELAE